MIDPLSTVDEQITSGTPMGPEGQVFISFNHRTRREKLWRILFWVAPAFIRVNSPRPEELYFVGRPQKYGRR